MWWWWWWVKVAGVGCFWEKGAWGEGVFGVACLLGWLLGGLVAVVGWLRGQEPVLKRGFAWVGWCEGGGRAGCYRDIIPSLLDTRSFLDGGLKEQAGWHRDSIPPPWTHLRFWMVI